MAERLYEEMMGKVVLVVCLLTLCPNVVFGIDAEQAWRMLPEYKKKMYERKAKEMGYDLSTPEGRREFLVDMRKVTRIA